jgi:RNA polymerase subunit RPABC4/transcription elongation factor Spt4
MAKKYANKQTKRLLTESAIKELNMQIGEFSDSWQGRIYIKDVANSHIAKEIGIKKKGEFAIKIR